METDRGSEQADKVLLRQKFRELRRKFKSDGGRVVAQQLQQNLQKFLTDFAKPEVQVCLYRARRDEAPCELTPRTGFFYPVLKGDHLEFRKPLVKSAFQTNALAFEEPVLEQSTPLDITKPLLVFCPAVAVDLEGRRLGLGKGYYDRFFTTHTDALRVGVVFHVQISSQPLPAESWDQAMDWIVTEKTILRVQATRSS